MAMIEDKTFKNIRDYIYSLTGIYIGDNKKYFIENRLENRLKECKKSSFEEYFDYIKSHKGNGELLNLYNAITTNETYFFREQDQIYACLNHLIPMVRQKKNKIKIWSCACSTGEEPYTISMVQQENYKDYFIEIIASDISELALQSAKRGIYNSYSVRNVPIQYLEKYFKKVDNLFFELDEKIKRTVSFYNINLINPSETKKISNVDIVFCRNVLIYFDEKSKQKALSNIYDSMVPGGFLFLSMSESLHNVTRAFKPYIMNRVVAYQKV